MLPFPHGLLGLDVKKHRVPESERPRPVKLILW